MGIIRGIVDWIDMKFEFKNTDTPAQTFVKGATGGFIEGVADGVFLAGVIVFVTISYMNIKNIFKK